MFNFLKRRKANKFTQPSMEHISRAPTCCVKWARNDTWYGCDEPVYVVATKKYYEGGQCVKSRTYAYCKDHAQSRKLYLWE